MELVQLQVAWGGGRGGLRFVKQTVTRCFFSDWVDVRRSAGCRQAIAWSVALALTLLALFTSLVYGLKFGEATMSTCMVAWALAYSWTLAVVQPIQVVILVLAPGLFRDDTRCGRCMLRLREMGGELLM